MFVCLLVCLYICLFISLLVCLFVSLLTRPVGSARVSCSLNAGEEGESGGVRVERMFRWERRLELFNPNTGYAQKWHSYGPLMPLYNMYGI